MSKISSIDDERVGLIIKFARERKCLTADQLATNLELGRPTLSNYENGKRPLPANRVLALARALDLDPRIINPQAA
jgi:transcriptional regulator with XRE-family HTH domain